MNRTDRERRSAPERLNALLTVAALGAMAVAAMRWVWFASQDRPADRSLLLTAAVAGLASLAFSHPLRRADLDFTVGSAALCTLGLLVLPMTTAFAASQASHAERLERSPAQSVPATVSQCRTTGVVVDHDGTGGFDYACTYTWTADGVSHSEERAVDSIQPDHATTVRLDNGRMITSEPGSGSVVFWALLAIAAAVAAVPVTVVLVRVVLRLNR